MSSILDAATEKAAEKMLVRGLLVQYSQTRCTTLRDTLVSLHVDFVRFIARKFSARAESDDLYQVGLLGLLKAIDRFDPNNGAQFLTFATPTVMGEIKRYLRDHATTLRMPRSLWDLVPTVRRAIEQYTTQHEVAPTVAVIATSLNITEERVLEVLEALRTRHVISLDAPVTPSNYHPPEKGLPDGQLDHMENRMMVQQALLALTERDKLIIHNRFFKRQSQSAVAKLIGVSQMQVCRVERAALARMRDQLANRTWNNRTQQPPHSQTSSP